MRIVRRPRAPGRRLGARLYPGGPEVSGPATLFILLGLAFSAGLVGIAFLEYSQGARLRRR